MKRLIPVLAVAFIAMALPPETPQGDCVNVQGWHQRCTRVDGSVWDCYHIAGGYICIQNRDL